MGVVSQSTIFIYLFQYPQPPHEISKQGKHFVLLNFFMFLFFDKALKKIKLWNKIEFFLKRRRKKRS